MQSKTLVAYSFNNPHQLFLLQFSNVAPEISRGLNYILIYQNLT